MSAMEVTKTVDMLVAAINAGDAQAAAAHYEAHAAFVPQPGAVLDGRDAIRDALAGMAASGATIRTHSRSVVCSDDIALYQAWWDLTIGGKSMQTAISTDVLRRGADGRWRIVIDNPWGSDHLQAAARALDA
jgi:uncharacterized protein (TIGR02246 family)